jgi:signal transduction histidine kinase
VPLAAFEGKPLGDAPGLQGLAEQVDHEFAGFVGERSQHGLDHWQQSFELASTASATPSQGPSAGHNGVTLVARGAVLPNRARLLVFDDISEIVSAQRAQAWGDVARRLAHEIKNPLASLRSALDGAERIEDPQLRKQLMDVAKADVQRMDRLISDISDASRVDSQLAKAKFEPIDLGDMIEQLLQAREDRASDKNVNIAFARPRRNITTVMGEDVRLERMLTNLIDNAVSFSPPGAVVEISATLADEDVIIRISDEGPGVPPQEREAIFRRFHSERPATENFGKHSGLGLAIARTIIEGHHGRIGVRDRVDGKGGACFEIALPCAAAATRQ